MLGALETVAALALAGAPQSPPPRFDAATSLVLVDVVVTDKKHRPVLDLRAADFAVFEDGVRRPIVSFAAFGAAATRARADATAGTAGAVPFVKAASALVIDEHHMGPGEAARLRPALRRVLEEFGERQGELLVMAPASGIALAGSLPRDAAALAEAAGRIGGRRHPDLSRWPMTDAEAFDVESGDPLTLARVEARFRAFNPGLPTQMVELVRERALELTAAARARRAETFSAVALALAWLARQPGRHTLLLASPGFPNDPFDPAFDRLATESLRANAPIHVLDVAALAGFAKFEGIDQPQALPFEARVAAFEASDGWAGVERLAADSGGLRLRGDDLVSGLGRVLDTTRTYYVLGYEPLPGKKPGFRKIKVAARDKGLSVLARRGYFAEAPPAAPAPRP